MLPSLAVFHDKQFQCIALSHSSTILGTNLFMPILSVFLQYKGFSETQIGLIIGVTAASALFIRPWVGLSVDTKGSRWAILIGQVLFFLSTTGYLLASQFMSFFILRLLFGIGLAFYGTGAVTFASSIGQKEIKTNAIAMYTLITMLGLGISMGVSQIAFDAFGFDALIIVSLVLIILAFGVMKLTAKTTLPRARGKRAPFLAVLKSPVITATTISQFAAGFSFSALFTFIPLASLAENIHFYSLYFISFAVLVIGSRFFVQQLNDTLGLQGTIIYSSLAMLISTMLLFIGITPLVLIIAGGLFGIGFGAVFPTLVLLIVKKTPENSRGTALSILTASSDIGNALSAAILGVVAEHLGYGVLFGAIAITILLSIYGFYAICGRKAA
ncbi:MAG: MFS transporter [Pelosinus sp.]|nr:MFS transporter [Pelosinus sp.]